MIHLAALCQYFSPASLARQLAKYVALARSQFPIASLRFADSKSAIQSKTWRMSALQSMPETKTEEIYTLRVMLTIFGTLACIIEYH